MDISLPVFTSTPIKLRDDSDLPVVSREVELDDGVDISPERGHEAAIQELEQDVGNPSTGTEPVSDQTAAFRCLICDPAKSFLNRSSLKRHSRIHTGNMLRCAECPKQFFEQCLLHRHMTESHTPGSHLACSYCGQRYKTKMGLKRHEQLHQEAPMSCSMCHKGLSYKHLLEEHERSHTGERPFSCSNCTKRFFRSRDIKFHTEICGKSDEPFVCVECGKAFKTEKYLQSHKHTHEASDQVQCGDCGKLYSHKSSLRSHMKKKHQ